MLAACTCSSSVWVRPRMRSSRRRLEFSSFVPAIENVLGTLLSLAETQENRFAIAEAGAVGLLIRQLESQHRAVVEKAAGVIWNLAHEDSVRTAIRQLGGLKPLIDLLRHTDPLIRFNTVGAFPLLTEQLENRTRRSTSV